MTLIVDYSWARPDPGAIRAAGYVGAMRYLSPDPSKNLTPSERDGLFAAGLSIGLVWETVANRAAQGAAAGTADAQAADAQADTLGYPVECPIFYAVDFDTPAAPVEAYFQGVRSASRRPVGVYGSADVVQGVPVPYKWQASAWSNGVVSPFAHLYQRLTPTVATPIGSTDENVVLTAFPMWDGALQVGSGAGVPTSTPTTTMITPEDEMTPDQAAALARLDQNVVNVADRLTAIWALFGTGDPLVNRVGKIDDTHDKVLQIHNGVASLPTLLAANLGGAPDPTAIAAEILKLGPQLAAEIAAHLAVTVTPTP